MPTIRILLMIITTLSIGLNPAYAEQSLKDVKKAIGKKLGQIRTLQFDYQIKHSSKYVLYDFNFTKDFTTKGSVKIERKGDEFLGASQETKIQKEVNLDEGDVYDTKIESKNVLDGKFRWSYEKRDEYNQSVIKSKREELEHNLLNPKHRLSKERWEQKLLPDAEVDGKKSWVMELIPKTGIDGIFYSKVIVYIDQETGLECKRVGFKEDEEVETTTIKDVKINEKIDPKSFEFIPPKDVPIIDWTDQ